MNSPTFPPFAARGATSFNTTPSWQEFFVVSSSTSFLRSSLLQPPTLYRWPLFSAGERQLLLSGFPSEGPFPFQMRESSIFFSCRLSDRRRSFLTDQAGLLADSGVSEKSFFFPMKDSFYPVCSLSCGPFSAGEVLFSSEPSPDTSRVLYPL